MTVHVWLSLEMFGSLLKLPKNFAVETANRRREAGRSQKGRIIDKLLKNLQNAERRIAMKMEELRKILPMRDK